MQSASTQSPILQLGSRGPEVEELQALLQQRVAVTGLVADGIFGPTTELAVKVVQYRMFLKQDGIVGAKTWKALRVGRPVELPVLKRGSRGDVVARLQQVLNFSEETQQTLGAKGYYFSGVDGDFGTHTETAVMAFQKDQNLAPDGIVGPKTWQALSELAARISHISL